VVSTAHEHGRLVVSGLRDPRARDPLTLIAGTGLAADGVEGRWSPYYALDPSLVLARAHAILQPPNGTSLVLEDGILSATGTPSMAWVTDARRLAPLVAGVSRFDAANALDASMQAVIGRIARRAILFNKGAARPVDGQAQLIRELAQDVRELDEVADAAGQRLRVEVVGHTDADGPAESNVSLSRTRAGAVLAGGSMSLAYTMGAHLAPASRSGLTLSMLSSCGQLGCAIAPILGGIIGGLSLSYVFIANAGAYVLALGLAALPSMGRATAPQREEPAEIST
jgi:hypothetical protein